MSASKEKNETLSQMKNDSSTTISTSTLTSNKSNSQQELMSTQKNPIQSKSEQISDVRKQELLLEARRTRVEWVDASSHPLGIQKNKTSMDSKTVLNDIFQSNNENKGDDSFLNPIQMCHAGQSIKSALEIAKCLYGIDDEQGGGLTYHQAKDRISKQVR